MAWLDLPHIWIYLGGYWLLLVVLAGVEIAWPMHVSQRDPDGRLLTNFGMGLLGAAVFALIPVSLVAAAQWADINDFGLLNRVPLPWVAAAVLTIAIRSLAGYWMHRLLHSIGLLWRFHRVHHCDVAMDLSTGFRNHPIETLIAAAGLTGIALLFGFPPIPLAIYEIVNAGFALWTHANFRLPPRAERILRSLFVTPDMHHVHHSVTRAQTDSNYGDVFSFWDRLFGSYHALDRDALRALRFGLGDADDRHAASIIGQLRAPLLRQASARSNGD